MAAAVTGFISEPMTATSSHTVGQAANVVFTDNAVTNSSSSGIRVYTHDYGSTDVDITGGSVTGSGSHGIYADTNYYGEGLLDITGVTITGSTGHGIYAYPYYRSRMRGSFSGNTLSGNTDMGIYIYARENRTYKPKSEFVIDGNTIDGTGSGDQGIYCFNEYSYLKVEVTNNEVHHATQGIYCRSQSYANYTYEALVSDNQVHDNTGTGILCHRNYQATMTAEVRNNHVYQNGGNGIQCSRVNANAMDAVITLNSVHDNALIGLVCQATAPAVILKNDIYANGGNGLELTAGNGSVVNYNNLYNNLGPYALVNSDVSPAITASMPSTTIGEAQSLRRWVGIIPKISV